MSRPPRPQIASFPAEVPVIEAESTVDETVSLPVPDTAPEAAPEAPSPDSEPPHALPFMPKAVESLSTQHDIAEHIAKILAEEGAVMESSVEKDPEPFLDLDSVIADSFGPSIIPLPDGSLRATVIVPAEMAPVIREWANGAGEDFETYLQRMMDVALNAVVLGGSVAG